MYDAMPLSRCIHLPVDADEFLARIQELDEIYQENSTLACLCEAGSSHLEPQRMNPSPQVSFPCARGTWLGEVSRLCFYSSFWCVLLFAGFWIIGHCRIHADILNCNNQALHLRLLSFACARSRPVIYAGILSLSLRQKSGFQQQDACSSTPGFYLLLLTAEQVRICLSLCPR
jgi:hypothetical protein